VKEDGWAELLDELLAKVLELLHAAGQTGGLGFSSDLRHGAAGVRCVEGRARCTGDAAGAETADHRRGNGHAGAAVPGGVAGGERYAEKVLNRRRHASSEQLH
jgi:hypothetical protein